MYLYTPILIALACIAPAMAAQHTIRVTDQGFEPSTLCIDRKDSVTWHFLASGHSVAETVAVGSCDVKGTFITPVMHQGWRRSRTFDDDGTFSFASTQGQDCPNGYKGVIYTGSACNNGPVVSTTSDSPSTSAGTVAPLSSTSSNNNANTDMTDNDSATVKSKTEDKNNLASTQQTSWAVFAIVIAAAGLVL